MLTQTKVSDRSAPLLSETHQKRDIRLQNKIGNCQHYFEIPSLKHFKKDRKAKVQVDNEKGLLVLHKEKAAPHIGAEEMKGPIAASPSL